jgi:hypothetical protein
MRRLSFIPWVTGVVDAMLRRRGVLPHAQLIVTYNAIRFDLRRAAARQCVRRAPADRLPRAAVLPLAALNNSWVLPSMVALRVPAIPACNQRMGYKTSYKPSGALLARRSRPAGV